MLPVRCRIAGNLAAFLLCFFPFTLGTLHAQTAARLPDPLAEAGAEPEGTQVRALRVQWRKLFNDGSWSELDALADQLRSQRSRFAGGGWQLRYFYGTICCTGSLTATDADWQAQFARLQEWIKQEPASAVPRVALADAYLRFAWKARGNGYANTVTQEGWSLFRQRVQQARTTLEDAAKISAGDPEWYRAMQTVALAEAWPRSQVDALVNAALDSEPGYFYFARAQANFLLPKWYGKPGDTEQFSEKVADRIGGQEGDAVYFLIAAVINCCRVAQAPGLSWARVRQGYFALQQLYGTNNYQRNAMAYLALQAGDTQTAQQMFRQIGNDWDQAVWRSKARFDASRIGQSLGTTQPVQTEKPSSPDPEN